MTVNTVTSTFTRLQWRQITPVILVYMALAFIAMAPASFKPHVYKFGNIKVSDSLAAIHSLWVRGLSIEDSQPMSIHIGAPTGVPKTSGFFLFALTSVTAMAEVVFNQIAGPIFAFNAVIFLSFLLAGYFTHRLVLACVNNTPAAYLAGLIYMMSPYHILQAADHHGLAQTWVFPLFILLVLRLVENQTVRQAIKLGVFCGFCTWVHGYYGLFVLIALPFLIIALLATRSIQLDRRFFQIAGATIGGIGIFFVPWVLRMGFFTTTKSGGQSLARPLHHLYLYGIRWYEYFLPPFYSLPFSGPVNSFLAGNMHGSNHAEMTIFLGFIPLAFVIYYLVHCKQKKLLRTPHIVLLLTFASIPILLGLPPEITWFGIKIPTLSTLSYKLFPSLRTLSRYGIMTILSTAVFAGLGFHILSQKWSTNKSTAIALVCAFLIFIEFTPIHKGFYLDSSRIPKVYEALKLIPENSVVLELPYRRLNNFIPYFWQMHHHQNLFNIHRPSHPNFRKIMRIQQSKTLGDLLHASREQGIDYLIYHGNRELPQAQNFHEKIDAQTILQDEYRVSSLFKLR